GGAVAANLVADGHEVTVHDLDAARAGAIEGATAVGSVAEVGSASEVTILSLPTPSTVRTIAERWSVAAAPGSVLVDLSTNSPEAVRELGARLEATGHHLVEAPLTGGAPGAQNRALVFMLGGDEAAVSRVLPVL